MANLQPRPTDSGQSGCVAFGLVGFIVLLVIVLGRGGSDPSPVNSESASNSTTSESDAALTPQAPLPLNLAAARLGLKQFQLIAARHIPATSEIFIQNCYEAVGSPTDWAQLDRCGAYDAVAVRWTELHEDSAGQDDLSYFQSETAATRYLQAANKGGLNGSDSDARWSALQRLATAVKLTPKPPVQIQLPDDESGAEELIDQDNVVATSIENAAEDPGNAT